MKKYFMGTEESIERWGYAVAFVTVTILWGIALCMAMGVI